MLGTAEPELRFDGKRYLMTLTLSFKDNASVPVEVEGVTPDSIRELSLDEVREVEIHHGNVKVTLADFFDVSGDPSDERHVWQGNLSGVHWLGAGMKSGEIKIEGSVGRHVGSEMLGGTIQIDGDAGDWIGAEMRGGLIQVAGNVGHLAGAGYRGSPRGMRGGTILVKGNAGNELGHTMRRGLIAIAGDCGDLAGFNMLAGSVLIFGKAGIRHGAGMRRGTIGFFGPETPSLLPTFTLGCRYKPDIMTLVFRFLEQHGFAVPESVRQGSFDIYHGDMIEGGRGEVLIAV